MKKTTIVFAMALSIVSAFASEPKFPRGVETTYVIQATKSIANYGDIDDVNKVSQILGVTFWTVTSPPKIIQCNSKSYLDYKQWIMYNFRNDNVFKANHVFHPNLTFGERFWGHDGDIQYEALRNSNCPNHIQDDKTFLILSFVGSDVCISKNMVKKQFPLMTFKSVTYFRNQKRKNGEKLNDSQIEFFESKTNYKNLNMKFEFIERDSPCELLEIQFNKQLISPQ